MSASRRHPGQAGFTFIEVLIAMLIFVMAAVTALILVRGAVRTTRQTKEITVATWLLQNIMTELETKVETVGFDQGCEKKTEGKFAAPYENYRWVSYCTEIDFRLSQTAAQVMAAQQKGEDEVSQSENQMLKQILDTASTYITSSMRELHAEVIWTLGKQQRSVSATTHVIRLDQPLPSLGLPSIPAGGS